MFRLRRDAFAGSIRRPLWRNEVEQLNFRNWPTAEIPSRLRHWLEL